jgi:hypothetical protein
VEQVGGDKADFLHAWVFCCLNGEQRYGSKGDERPKLLKLHLKFAPVLRGYPLAVSIFVDAVSKFYNKDEVKTVSALRRSSKIWLTTRLIVCKDMDYEAQAPIIHKALTYDRIEQRKVSNLTEIGKVAGTKERGRPRKFQKDFLYFDGVSFSSYDEFIQPIEKHPFRVEALEGKKVDVLPRSQFLVISQKNFDQFPFIVIDGEKENTMRDDQINTVSASIDTDLVGILSQMYQDEWINSPQANNEDLWRPKRKAVPINLATRWLKYYVSQLPPNVIKAKATVDELRIHFGDFVSNANGNVMENPPFLNVVKFGLYMNKIIKEKAYPITKCRVKGRAGYKFNPTDLNYFLNKPTSTT